MGRKGIGGCIAELREHPCTNTGVKERNTFARKPAVNCSHVCNGNERWLQRR